MPFCSRRLKTDKTMSRQTYARPIVALLLALIGGIVLGEHFSGHPAAVLIIGLVSAGCMGIRIAYKKAAAIGPLIFFAALGYVSVQPWLSPDFPDDHIYLFSDETPWQVTGVVDSPPVEIEYLKRFVLRAETLKQNNESYRVSGRIRVSVRGPGPDFARGDRVTFLSRLREIRNFNNPGGFDYQRAMAYQNIWRSAHTQGSRLKVVDKNSAKDLPQLMQDARLAVAALIDRAGKQKPGAVLKALLIGDRTAISTELREGFNRAGVGHILAISGLHIGIVAGVAFVFFQKLFCLIKPLLWRAWTRKAAAIFSIFPVCVYGLISGMSPSTQRAVIMVTAFLMTFLAERETDTINTLALAAFIILIIYPPSLFSISFQLSFMAVSSIIYGFSHIRLLNPDGRVKAKTEFGGQLRGKLSAFFLVSFFAICGTLPLVMYYFNQISLIGLFANCLVVPLVGFGVLPCGLFAMLIYPFSIQIAYGCVQWCILVLEYVLMLVNYMAHLKFAAIATFTPSILEIVCYYVLGWIVVDRLTARPIRALSNGNFSAGLHHGFFSKNPFYYSGRFGLSRLLASITVIQRWLTGALAGKGRAVAGLLIVAVLVADAGYWLFERYLNAELRVTYIDVGQGSAALLELPGGHAVLIDGGGFSDNNAFDMGARVIAPFLRRKKIQTIDALVLSHPNSDHLNGLVYIAETFKVKTVWTNGEARDTLGYKDFREIIDRKHLDFPDFTHMPRKRLINGVEFYFLYPPADFLATRAAAKWRAANTSSLVLKVSFGKVAFLFPGDIEQRAEKELVNLAGEDLACDVLLVPHHGSRSSSSREFLSRVQPEVAVISVGWKNRFRFPHAAVLQAYQKSGCRIFRTDRNGAIVLTTDGGRLTVKPSIVVADNK
jgi:competence protein ComEC